MLSMEQVEYMISIMYVDFFCNQALDLYQDIKGVCSGVSRMWYKPTKVWDNNEKKES